MDRTESVVIQVSPSVENAVIAEREKFGWNLHGRQEIHERGNAYGEWNAAGTTYIIKQEVSHYTKLHFVRSLRLPNLDKIRAIEQEYDNLPYPSLPSQGCAVALGVIGLGLGLCGLVSVVLGIAGGGAREEGGLGLAVMAILCLGIIGVSVGLGVLWYRSNEKKRKAAMEIRLKSVHRAAELLAEAQKLL